MELSEILSLFDQELRREMEYPDVQKEVTPYVVRFIRPLPGRSIVLHSNLDESNADAAISEQIEYFTSRGLRGVATTKSSPATLPPKKLI